VTGRAAIRTPGRLPRDPTRPDPIRTVRPQTPWGLLAFGDATLQAGTQALAAPIALSLYGFGNDRSESDGQLDPILALREFEKNRANNLGI
jgi:hypothetical protein